MITARRTLKVLRERVYVQKRIPFNIRPGSVHPLFPVLEKGEMSL